MVTAKKPLVGGLGKTTLSERWRVSVGPVCVKHEPPEAPRQGDQPPRNGPAVHGGGSCVTENAVFGDQGTSLWSESPAAAVLRPGRGHVSCPEFVTRVQHGAHRWVTAGHAKDRG